MGLSSRQPFNLTEPKEVISYFIDAIENWREIVGIVQKFVLIGHSFGGYMSGMYFS